MQPAQSIFPMRAMIRCKAKQKLITDPARFEARIPLDESLFQEVAMTLLQSDYYQTIAQPCGSNHEAARLEDQIAAELVNTYRQIKAQQQSPVVQWLNTLL